jgi:DNA polymerase-1
MRTLLAVDGSNLLHRGFHGGRCENAERAAGVALSMLRKAIRHHRPSHCVVALDGPGPTWRHREYPEYKATRSSSGPSTAEMTDALIPLLNAAGLAHVASAGYEADDVLATLCARCGMRSTAILILSRDSDLLQCAAYAQILWPEKGEDVAMGAPETRTRTGVWPHQIAAWKALCGDSSDNLPRLGAVRETKAGSRLYGFTQKRAAELLCAHESLDGIYANLTKCEPAEYGWLHTGRERAYLNLRLATLREDVPLDLDPRATRIPPPDGDYV